MKNWAEKENLAINTEVGDIRSLPYNNNSFDCLFSYHVISHTDSTGIKKIISEIERVLKPKGEAYLSLSSKDSTEFIEKWWPALDENTLISQTPAEKGIPHFYADLKDISELLINFDIENIKHRGYFDDDSIIKQKFFYVNTRKK